MTTIRKEIGLKLNKFTRRSVSLAAGLALCGLLTTGCGSSDDFVFTENQQAAPVAADDNIVALGNATLNQAAANGVLVNDAPNGAAIASFDAVSTQGGAVAVNADGSFTYTPAFGFRGNDTFTYTLTNPAGSSTGTVTLDVNNAGWFVDNGGANGDGAQATPFNNLNDALGAAQSGDTIFVFTGDGTTNSQAGDFNLPADVNLIGEGTGLILAQTIVPQGTAPMLEGTLTAGGGNTISGFIFDVGDDDENAIEANGVPGITVANNTFRNGQEDYIQLDNLTGTTTIDGNTFEPLDDDEYFLDLDFNSNGTLNLTNNTFTDDNNHDPDDGVHAIFQGTSVYTFNASGNTFTSNDPSSDIIEDAFEIDVEGTADLTVDFNNNTFTNVRSGFDLDTLDPGANLTGSVANNTCTATTDNSIEIDVEEGTADLTITGNVISDCEAGAIDLDTDDALSTMMVIVSDNMVTDTTGDHAFELGLVDGSSGVVALRGNTFTGSADDSINVIAFGDADACLEITNNTVNDDMLFEHNGTGTISVELLDTLGSVNTFLVPIVIDSGTGDIDSVAAGFCAIP
jgi:hypothetical protein